MRRLMAITALCGLFLFGASTTSVASNASDNRLEITFPSSCCVNGTAGASYSQTFDANGGLKPYRWSIVKGELPPGLQITNSYSTNDPGVISGTPTTAGTFAFTVRVTDSLGDQADMNGKITIH